MGEIVTFPSNGGTCQGYLAKPASGSGPGVIVIQEWWGLTSWIQSIADRLAAEGYVALAPDLYHGEKAAEPDEAQKLMMAMKMDKAALDMSGAYDYLKANSTGKVGSIGFCLGGGLSLFISTLKPTDACVVYYGVLPGAQPDLTKLRAPVLGHYAENDGFCTPEAARALEQQIKGAGKQVEFHIYPGTTHAFMNTSDPIEKVGMSHNPEASKLAWDRTVAFYKQHLS
jgi:carboxymethylenebutenolidase